MAREGQAKGDQTRQQICSRRLMSKRASRASWWPGGEEERTRAGESGATELKNKQLGIANNSTPPGEWRGREIFCQTVKHLHFSLCKGLYPSSSASRPCVPAEGFSAAPADRSFSQGTPAPVAGKRRELACVHTPGKECSRAASIDS